jgi:cytochrome P450
MGGQETTANALTWAWYLLSQNPEAEGRFHEEIDRVLGNRQPAAGDLPQLRFTEAVFAETLRLYPSGWLIARRTLCEYHIDQYLVPANTVIVMSPYLVQRDERWFPNPHEFRPERWLIPGADRHAQHSKFVYFPFSRGMRNCIGERFAWMEGVLALATIGLRWRLRLEPGHRVKMQPLIVSRAEYGMRMIAERRSPTAPDTARTSGAVRPAHPQSHQCPAGFTDSSKCVADPRRVENG